MREYWAVCLSTSALPCRRVKPRGIEDFHLLELLDSRSHSLVYVTYSCQLIWHIYLVV